MYDTAARGCYRAKCDIEAGTTVAPNPAPSSAPPYWAAVTVAEAFEEYLVQIVAAAIMTEDQGKYQTQAAADRALDDLVERFGQGAGERRVRTGRFGR